MPGPFINDEVFANAMEELAVGTSHKNLGELESLDAPYVPAKPRQPSSPPAFGHEYGEQRVARSPAARAEKSGKSFFGEDPAGCKKPLPKFGRVDLLAGNVALCQAVGEITHPVCEFQHWGKVIRAEWSDKEMVWKEVAA